MINNKTKDSPWAIAAASYGMNPLFTLPLYSAGMSVVLGIILSLCTGYSCTRYHDEDAETIFCH